MIVRMMFLVVILFGIWLLILISMFLVFFWIRVWVVRICFILEVLMLWVSDLKVLWVEV